MPDKNKNGKWQDLVDYCFDLYEEFKDSEYRQNKIDKIKESYRVYQQQGKSTTFPWKDASNVVLPMHAITVDNLEPRLVAGLVGKKPVVEFKMEGLNEHDDMTVIIEDWFNTELDTVIKVESLAGSIVHKALLEGTVYPIVSYNETEKIQRDFVFDDKGRIVVDDETGEPITEDKPIPLFKGCKVEFAKFSDIYVADDAEDWDEANVIRMVRPTYGELMELADKKGYMNIGPDLLSEEIKEKEKDQSPDDVVDNIKITGQEVIECLECHVSYVMKKEDQEDEDVKDWTPERYVALITKNTKTLLRLVPLREINFKNEKVIKRIRLYREPGKSYGSSVYEKIQSIQDGATDLFNMVVNVATVTMIPWFMYTDKTGMESDAEITPGKGIRVDDTSQILFPRFNQNPRSYIVFIEMFMSLWEKLGSIGDIQIGRLSESRKDATATETMAAIQEGNIKHNYQSMSLKEDFISVIKTIYDLYYQKMEFNKEFLFHGQPVKIPRAAMRRNYKFKLVGSTDLSNKVLEIQKTQQMYQSLRADPVTNPIQLVTDLVQGFKPDSDPRKYINPQISQLIGALQQNPEIMQVIQQYMMQKQQQTQPQQPSPQAQQADIAVKAAQAQKLQAETSKVLTDTQLTKEKIRGERVDQVMKMHDGDIARDKVQTEKARILADVITKNARPTNT